MLFRKLYGLCFDKIVSIVNIRGAVKNRFPFIIGPCHQKLFVCMCVCALVSANVCVCVLACTWNCRHLSCSTYHLSQTGFWTEQKASPPSPTQKKKTFPPLASPPPACQRAHALTTFSSSPPSVCRVSVSLRPLTFAPHLISPFPPPGEPKESGHLWRLGNICILGECTR